MSQKWPEPVPFDVPATTLTSQSAKVRAEDPAIDGLLGRMRNGDREAAAIFIMKYGSRIRRRIRGKLNRSMRRVFDSQEILSTLGRRLDVYVRSRRFEAVDGPQLWTLVLNMAENAVVDKSRVFHKLKRCEREDGPFAQQFLRRLEDAERQDEEGVEIEIGRVIESINDPIDREILKQWLMETPHTEIAASLNLTPAAVRKRWQNLRNELRERLGPEGA